MSRPRSTPLCADCGHEHVNGDTGSCSVFLCDCKEYVAPIHGATPEGPSLTAGEYAAALRADLQRAYDALGGLQRAVEQECAKSRPSKQRLREALHRSDLGAPS